LKSDVNFQVTLKQNHENRNCIKRDLPVLIGEGYNETKLIIMVLTLWFWYWNIFHFGYWLFHYRLWRFVSGLYWKFQWHIFCKRSGSL